MKNIKNTKILNSNCSSLQLNGLFSVNMELAVELFNRSMLGADSEADRLQLCTDAFR
jgi:hypothetical protein